MSEIGDSAAADEHAALSPPTDEHDADEAAEQAMVAAGLEQSQVTPHARAHPRGVFHAAGRSESVMFLSPHQLLGAAAGVGVTSTTTTTTTDSLSPPPTPVTSSKARKHRAPIADDVECVAAFTMLLIPFSFWPTEDKESAPALADALLSRMVRDPQTGEQVPLWVRAGLSKGTAELSAHFRQLLGAHGGASAPVQRIRVGDGARAALFSGARLWADTRQGDFVGRRCEWTDVQLSIFPHGAILVVELNWMPDDARGDAFTLADMLSWVHLGKYRSIKVGVTRGWTFARRAPLDDGALVERETAALGLKFFAALYGGSAVSLGSVANWLVKMPEDEASALPRRIARFDYCQHHSFAQTLRRPRERALDKFLFHIRKAHGPRRLRPVPSDVYLSRFTTDQLLNLSPHCVIACAREGVFELEWGADVVAGSQRRAAQFSGLFFELSLHTLSERVTLERLSFFSALESQRLAVPGVSGRLSAAERERARLDHAKLNSMLIRYRTSMASEDCGGSVEARKFFKVMRIVHSTASFKETLLQQFEDANYILDCEWK